VSPARRKGDDIKFWKRIETMYWTGHSIGSFQWRIPWNTPMNIRVLKTRELGLAWFRLEMPKLRSKIGDAEKQNGPCVKKKIDMWVIYC
jgi:hypothetical protein